MTFGDKFLYYGGRVGVLVSIAAVIAGAVLLAVGLGGPGLMTLSRGAIGFAVWLPVYSLGIKAQRKAQLKQLEGQLDYLFKDIPGQDHGK